LKEKFDAINLRVELDSRNEKIGYKIREHSNAKVPLMAVIGKDEMSAHTVSIRNLRKNETNTYSIDEVLELLEVNSSPPN
jgi:threonyl-tRNA synthetase